MTEPQFRLAAVFDRVDPVSGPGFAEDHPRLAEGGDRTAVTAYLRAGAPVLLTPMLADDVVEPERGGVVPMGFRTDGEWIWTDTVSYYLEEYGIAPEPGLLAHVRAKDGVLPVAPDAGVLAAAVSFVLTPTDEPVWSVGTGG
ncbi:MULTISPECIES: hypothetical protein [Kitasatospora]|uniref:hypothetical protein n=1 Tax=Kitasatospora TaxID=2063 RepID=UPI000C704383|nr:hypothetical protein [Kitasatospora sp. GP30]MDH6143819.1 hypothetical protein [Kitasatospora sp. GP30]